MRLLLALSILSGTLAAPAAEAHRRTTRPCSSYHGRAYVICRESGPRHMPYGLAAGVRHYPGTRMTAAGPCGLIRANQRRYGGSGLAACTRYMQDRYGSWRRAERFHRAKGWW